MQVKSRADRVSPVRAGDRNPCQIGQGFLRYPAPVLRLGSPSRKMEAAGDTFLERSIQPLLVLDMPHRFRLIGLELLVRELWKPREIARCFA